VPGTILLSAATQHLVQEDVWVEPQGEVTVGAPQAPVPIYGVRGIATPRSGVVGRGARARSPFVGRDRELALLQERLDAVMAGQGQVVAIVGEPGLGKSRLLAEYRRSLVEREVRYVEGHCLSYGSATPYLPVLDLVRQLCGMTAGEPRDAITAKVHQRLLEADIASDESVPLLLHLLDIPVEMERLAQLSLPERKARTFALLRQLILYAAQRQPCIITVENLHWIDPTSEEWLTSLIERLPGAALLLLVTYRPGYQPPWLAQSYATQIALSPLRADDSRTVVQAVLRTATVPETLLQEILTKAAGNPFFLEELAWNAVEHEVHDTPLSVPETIEAVLAARIDMLPPTAKRLLQTAAVIGMHVAVPILQAIADLSAEELHTHLDHLQTAEFLYETGRPPASAYAFKHALTQEVAYGSLLQEQRRMLHGRIVEALEALYPDRLVNQVELLAHHALWGEVWNKAFPYCRQAGVKAGARSAYREAVAYLEQALVALRHLPERRDTLEQAIDLRLDLRAVLVPLGELGQIFDCLREAEALAEALDDQLRLGQVSIYMAQYFWLMGDPERTIELGERAHTLASTLGDFALQVNTNLFLGQGYRVLGDYRRAMDAFRQNVVSLEGELLYTRFDLASYLPSVISRTWLVICLAACGEFTEGIARAEEGLQIAEAADPHSLIVALYGVGFVYLSKGDLYKAIPALERGLALCQSWDFLAWFPPLAAALGSVYTAAGRVAEAIPLLEQAVSQAGARNRTDEAGLLANLSRAYRLAGRMEEAMQLAGRALALSREHKQRTSQAWALRLLGETEAHRGPQATEQAAAHYRQALALAEELGMRPLGAHCHFGLGTLYASNGQAELAYTELTTAIALYRAMDMTFWLPPAEAVLAQVRG
jgi:tetratricopeptide (TPR) repeat protein